MSRLEDKQPEMRKILPIVDWASIGQEAPAIIDLGERKYTDPLPKADIVVITWTNDEWAALDHVFVTSQTKICRTANELREKWYYRTNGPDKIEGFALWGFYKMVSIKGKKVLLFKASVHLAYPPYCKGLKEMTNLIINEAQPKQIYSAGTAGGATTNENLGDTIVTNSGVLMLESDGKDKEREEANKCCSNITKVSCDWFPSTDLFSKVEDNLLFKLDSIVNQKMLNGLFDNAIHKTKDTDCPNKSKVTIDDLMNAPIKPENLGNPKGLNKKDIPLLSTDYYFIGTGDDTEKYSALEMDDAVIGYVAGKAGVDYAFVRNISDPIVPDKTLAGEKICDELRINWSSQIYLSCGMYTSYNGALITWAAIAGS